MQSLSESLMQLKLTYTAAWHASLMQQWQVIMEPFSHQIRLERMELRRIIIGVYDARWLAELHASSWMLLDRIRQALPDVPVETQIVCVWARRGNRVNRITSRPVIDEQNQLITLTDVQDRVISSIVDPELRNYCIEYWRRCVHERIHHEQQKG
jgi:hypothetical protein